MHALQPFNDYSEIELILVDGDSRDTSRETVEAYRSSVAYCKVERDNGIYDAMNKGINAAVGDWLWFINSGDVPAIDPALCLTKLAAADARGCNFIYSDLVIKNVPISQNLTFKHLAVGMINHQSCLYRKQLLSSGYDASYRFCADYAHLLQNLKGIFPFKSTEVLCRYDMSGVSSVVSRSRRRAIWTERLRAQLHAPLSITTKFIYVSISVSALIVKTLFPSFGSITRKK